MLSFLKTALVAVLMATLVVVSILTVVFAVGYGIEKMWMFIVPDILVGFVKAGLLPAELEFDQSLKLSVVVCGVTTLMLSLLRALFKIK